MIKEPPDKSKLLLSRERIQGASPNLMVSNLMKSEEI